jgi:hypothetical protein
MYLEKDTEQAWNEAIDSNIGDWLFLCYCIQVAHSPAWELLLVVISEILW